MKEVSGTIQEVSINETFYSRINKTTKRDCPRSKTDGSIKDRKILNSRQNRQT